MLDEPLHSFDFENRVRRLKEVMASGGCDVALFSIGADLPYLTGYEASPSERLTVLVVPLGSDPVLFVPKLEGPAATDVGWEVQPWSETEDPIALATSVVANPKSVVVGDHMWSSFLVGFQKTWSDADWTAASTLMSHLRIIKDPGEVDLLRRAAGAVDRVMARVPAEVAFEGRSEVEVARQLAELTVEEGHDSSEFTIVASGPNGASPHHHPSDRVISSGDLIVCDYGGRLGGYYSDSTRTFVVGEPSEMAKEIHRVVAEANRVGRSYSGPGVPCQEVDAVTRQVVDSAGYGEYFIHRTGHGIGLEVHEHPYIVEGNQTPLEPGMAFSIEPGVYVPGEFGVRIEDIVVCTSDGIESLNQSSRELISVS